MDLDYVKLKMKEISLIRSRILEEMNLDGQINYGHSFVSMKYRKSFSNLKDMKIACIMDEFTYRSLHPECNLFHISPQNWRQELEMFKPDLFFLESAWYGLNGLWHTKVAFLSNELIDVLTYCKKNDIPIVFWNKEDPIHFKTFLPVAKFADFVFTTDIDCIKSYKTILKHNRVYLMPFAAQTNIHNPVEISERKDKFCFAGAYYKEFPERAKDFDILVSSIIPWKNLDIFDRNYINRNPNYAFPKKYKRYVIGHLTPEEIHKAYKGYRFHINMNTVKQSQSMCSRRIFELLASNTVTFSNYSRAIRNLFGDLVICSDDGQRLRKEVNKFEDPEYYLKFRLLGLRKALAEHTYRQRLQFLVNKVFLHPAENQFKPIAVITCARTNEEIQRVIQNYKRQSYGPKKLYIITDNQNENLNLDDIQTIHDFTDEIIETIRRQYEYWTFFSVNDYYGKNYIYDLVLSLEFLEVPIIGKGEYFVYQNGSFKRVKEGKAYQMVNFSRVRKALIQSSYFTPTQLKTFAQSIEEGAIFAPSFSIDEFNYCMNYDGNECMIVDDLTNVDTGVGIKHLHDIVEDVQPNTFHSSTIILEKVNTQFDSGCFVNKSNILLITDNYPDYTNLYANAFIHSRIIGYKTKGLLVDIFKFNERSPKGYFEFDGVDVTSGYYEEINNVLMGGKYDTILIHFLTEALWEGIKSKVKGKKIIVWIHGAEIQPWWRRAFNYTTKEQLENAKKESDKRLKFWRHIFHLALEDSDYKIHFVFVSRYFANEVFEDLHINLPHHKFSVIHNHVNSDLFTYAEKDENLRKKILSIRPFTSKKYANDLTVKAILELSRDPIFNDLEFRLVGKGELFKDTVKPIRKYKNVILDERFLRQEEIAKLHKEYGIFLCPTRWDSQGVSRDEAMSSGLVPVTNNVSAIPEFVDQDCGVIAEAEDYKGLAEGIKKMYYNPQLFSKLSRNSAERVRRQCGFDRTITKEIELILGLNG